MTGDLTFARNPSPAPLSAQEFTERAVRLLLPLATEAEAQDEAALRNDGGDHRIDDALPFIADPSAIRRAAVLMPVVARAEATLLLTERAAGLAVHAGQIAFPGGRLEPGETALAAALREAQEEIGLSPELVSPLGALDPYLTGTGFRITPIVALVDPSFHLVPNSHEVADVFEAPLAFLMDPTNHEIHSRELRGRLRRFYAMPWEGRYIWGATAGMIRILYERVYGQ
ncbi:MAG: CoA pyrophosphatase [Hyphomicrobiales bacterium]|nr:CoA pyrophosphatase [Hyphomicrobiales bacterium]